MLFFMRPCLGLNGPIRLMELVVKEGMIFIFIIINMMILVNTYMISQYCAYMPECLIQY